MTHSVVPKLASNLSGDMAYFAARHMHNKADGSPLMFVIIVSEASLPVCRALVTCCLKLLYACQQLLSLQIN